MNEAAAREGIAHFAKSLFDRGYTVGSSGNISVRLADGLLITPTNSCFGDLDPARISRLDSSGRHIGGDKPSKEVFLHQAFLDTRPTAGAVVHLHSTYATAVSCLADIDPRDVLPPLTPYFLMRVGHLPLLPYFRPGDPAMGEGIRALEGRYAAVLLANHGPVVSAADLASAVYASEELEETAKLFLLLRGHPVRPVPADRIAELRQ